MVQGANDAKLGGTVVRGIGRTCSATPTQARTRCWPERRRASRGCHFSLLFPFTHKDKNLRGLTCEWSLRIGRCRQNPIPRGSAKVAPDVDVEVGGLTAVASSGLCVSSSRVGPVGSSRPVTPHPAATSRPRGKGEPVLSSHIFPLFKRALRASDHSAHSCISPITMGGRHRRRLQHSTHASRIFPPPRSSHLQAK